MLTERHESVYVPAAENALRGRVRGCGRPTEFRVFTLAGYAGKTYSGRGKPRILAGRRTRACNPLTGVLALRWWPFRTRETRQLAATFPTPWCGLIEAQAAGSAADASSTAAVEAAAGALSRAFASVPVSRGRVGSVRPSRRASWPKSGGI